MGSHPVRGSLLCVLLFLGSTARAGDHDRGGGSSSGMATANVPAAVSGGGIPYWYNFSPPYYSTIGPNGLPVSFVPPRWVRVPGFVVPPAPPGPLGPGWGGFGLAGPLPPPGMGPPRLAAETDRNKRKPDAAKATQLVTVGDRLFRAGNTRRAAERYEQAARANPLSAAPLVRLAQVALVRGQYAQAAGHLRDAQTAEPGWLNRASDIQTIYAEPADFARQIARLESHLQAEPGDRDAWLVLGAQWFLSGRTQKATDIFVRLSDRKLDPTLAAFLDAVQPVDRPRAN